MALGTQPSFPLVARIRDHGSLTELSDCGHRVSRSRTTSRRTSPTTLASGSAKFDARKAKVVELRYFGGMSVEETAEVLGVHPNTIINDWSLAKIWLKRELSREAARNAG
jgi:DNA-directed RNA polymerase specialized sigma24 family protein